LLIPLKFSLFVDNIKLCHNNIASKSLAYRFLTFYDLKKSSFRDFLYTNRIKRFEVLIKTKILDYPSYKFIVISDFFISYLYLRILVFDF
jgi:hypothetical protein